MQTDVARKILAVNYQFYQSFAADFSETRGRLQPGVLRILDKLDSTASILDLGCGNGELARHLGQRGFQGTYLGTDFSPALLGEARRRNQGNSQIEFTQLDLTQGDWSSSLPDKTFQVILCFSALHHIPSWELRLNAVINSRRFLDEVGQACLSNWQFLRSKRYRKRLLDWETVGISQDEVDEDDYLLDWRRGGRGIRYVHHFSPGELEELAAAGGFTIQESFYSDGKEGDLSLYQIWEPF